MASIFSYDCIGPKIYGPSHEYIHRTFYSFVFRIMRFEQFITDISTYFMEFSRFPWCRLCGSHTSDEHLTKSNKQNANLVSFLSLHSAKEIKLLPLLFLLLRSKYPSNVQHKILMNCWNIITFLSVTFQNHC